MEYIVDSVVSNFYANPLFHGRNIQYLVLDRLSSKIPEGLARPPFQSVTNYYHCSHFSAAPPHKIWNNEEIPSSGKKSRILLKNSMICIVNMPCFRLYTSWMGWTRSILPLGVLKKPSSGEKGRSTREMMNDDLCLFLIEIETFCSLLFFNFVFLREKSPCSKMIKDSN